MIEEPAGRIDYDETGDGPTIIFVPGSCSTGAAWRPVIAALNGGFRCVTTSLLGYGGTAERRPARDASIAHEAGASKPSSGARAARSIWSAIRLAVWWRLPSRFAAKYRL
jgi:pimeloyl-ACP methyl ester carboxylesterase